jgi:histone H2A
MSKRANLTFPVGRIGRFMRQKAPDLQCEKKAPVAMTAVMEYICAEVIDMAAEVMRTYRKKRITPKHITEAIRNDLEFKHFLSHVQIYQENEKCLGSITQIGQPFDMKYQDYVKQRKKFNESKA